MVYHDGNNSMLSLLLQAQFNTKNDNAREYYQHLIESIVDGLRQTAARGTAAYDSAYLDKLRDILKKRDK